MCGLSHDQWTDLLKKFENLEDLTEQDLLELRVDRTFDLL